MLKSSSIKLGVRQKMKADAKRPKKIKDPNRRYLSTCVGKLMAYERVNKKDEARQWAALLVDHLRKMDLLPPI